MDRMYVGLLVLSLTVVTSLPAAGGASPPASAIQPENSGGNAQILMGLIEQWKGREDLSIFPAETALRELSSIRLDPDSDSELLIELTDVIYLALKQRPQPDAYRVARNALKDSRTGTSRVAALLIMVSLGTREDDALDCVTEMLCSPSCTEFEADFVRHTALLQLSALGSKTIDEIGKQMIEIAVRRDVKPYSRGAALHGLADLRGSALIYRGKSRFQPELRRIVESVFCDAQQPTVVRNGAAAVLFAENSVSEQVGRVAIELIEDLQQDSTLRRSAFYLLDSPPADQRDRCVRAAILTLERCPERDEAELGVSALNVLKKLGTGAEAEREAVEQLLKRNPANRTLRITALETVERLERLAEK